MESFILDLVEIEAASRMRTFQPWLVLKRSTCYDEHERMEQKKIEEAPCQGTSQGKCYRVPSRLKGETIMIINMLSRLFRPARKPVAKPQEPAFNPVQAAEDQRRYLEALWHHREKERQIRMARREARRAK